MKKFVLKSALVALLVLGFQTPTYAAKLGLYPTSSALKKGCNYNVDVVINTEGVNSRGADAFLSYDSNKIEVLSISPGWVFKSYPGKVFGNGNIKITAFSQNGFYNGSGTLARIAFRSINDATSGGFQFKYSPGSTVDSNVADENSNDMLNGVWGADYTFEDGPCFVITPDTTPPWIELEDLKPGMDWQNMVPNTNIKFTIQDDKSGVDLDTLTVDVNDLTYTKDGENSFTYEGVAKKYDITINPEKDFIEEIDVNVTVNAKDNDENEMEPFEYTFGTYTLPEDYLRPAAPEPPTEPEVLTITCPKVKCPKVVCEEECPTLRGSAPEPQVKFWFPLILLILLIISLYFNFADVEFEEELNIRTKRVHERFKLIFKKDRKRAKKWKK